MKRTRREALNQSSNPPVQCGAQVTPRRRDRASGWGNEDYQGFIGRWAVEWPNLNQSGTPLGTVFCLQSLESSGTMSLYSQVLKNSASVFAENKVQVATCAVGNYSLKRHGPVHGRLFHRNL